MKRVLWSFLLFSFLGLVGCRKLTPITVEVQEGAPVFVFDKKISSKPVYLYDIALYRLDCKEDCVMWQAVNKEGDDGSLTHAVMDAGKIRYGQDFSALDVRVPPKKLISGKYSASVTASYKGKGGQYFYRVFELSFSDSGVLTVNNLPGVDG